MMSEQDTDLLAYQNIIYCSVILFLFVFQNSSIWICIRSQGYLSLMLHHSSSGKYELHLMEWASSQIIYWVGYSQKPWTTIALVYLAGNIPLYIKAFAFGFVFRLLSW